MACAGWAGAARAERVFFPEIGVRLQAARYLPSATDLVNEGWIGASAGLVRLDATTAYFAADLETVLGSTRRAFEAKQANYHLELGARRALSKGRAVGLFFHHVSRHEQDRAKPEAVDWNLVGVRGEAPLPRALGIAGRASLGLGRAIQESLIGYRFEITGQIVADLVTRPNVVGYGALSGRAMTAQASERFPRDGFLDFQAEAGVRFRRDGRMIELFLAFDRRSDVLIAEPLSKRRALLGFRIRSGRRHFAAPDDPAPGSSATPAQPGPPPAMPEPDVTPTPAPEPPATEAEPAPPPEPPIGLRR